MVSKKKTAPDDDFDFMVEDDLDFDLNLDFDSLEANQSSTWRKGKKKKNQPHGKPLKPQPWEDDWYDPDDYL